MKVYEFNPEIYPTRLWVVKAPVTIEELSNSFYAIDSEDIAHAFDDVYKLPESADYARCYIVSDKERHARGVLVLINAKKLPIGVIAHEASHCADWLCEYLGIESNTFVTGEARAYYVGWVAGKIAEVLKSRTK